MSPPIKVTASGRHVCFDHAKLKLMQTFSSGDFHYKFYLNLDYGIPDSAKYNQHDERELKRLLSEYRRIIALRAQLLTRIPPFAGGEPHLDGQILWHTQVPALVAKADGWRQHLEEIVLLFDEEYSGFPVWPGWCLCWTFDDWDTLKNYDKLVKEARNISGAIQKSRSSQPTFPWEGTYCQSRIPELPIGD